jgi:hypothetical protein
MSLVNIEISVLPGTVRWCAAGKIAALGQARGRNADLSEPEEEQQQRKLGAMNIAVQHFLLLR